MGENRGMSVGAVGLVGSHGRVRRVRAINFGRESAGVECFVISVAGAHPAFAENDEVRDCVIEDCTAEQPWENNVGETTILHSASGERQSDGIMAYARASVIRHCYVNGEFANGALVQVDSVEFRDGFGQFTDLGTLTTKQPHRHTKHKNLVLRGVENASLQNPFNGVFPIEDVLSPTILTYRMLAAPTTNPTGARMTVGNHVPSHWVKIDDIQWVTGRTYRITTRLPHYRTQKNNVKIDGVRLFKDGNLIVNHPFNGVYPIDAVHLNGNLEPKHLDYTLSEAPPDYDQMDVSRARIGADLQALSADGGTAAVVEGNRVVGCGVGGPYHDTWSTHEIIIRNNHYRDVHVGPRQNMGGVSKLKPGVSLKRVPSTLLACFTTQAAHGLKKGDAVFVRGALQLPFNGRWEIVEAQSKEFTYQMWEDPGVDEATGELEFAAIWQVRLIIVENNVIELCQDRGIETLPPVAIWLADQDPRKPYVFRRGVIRGNAIRQVDDLQEPRPVAVSISGFKQAIIQNNIVALTNPKPLYDYECGQIHYYNNRTPDGRFIPGQRRLPQGGYLERPGLERAVESALFLNL